MKSIHQTLFTAALLVCGAAAQAQMTPVGTWRTIDDSTGQPKSEVVITEDASGVLSGHIEKLLRPGVDPNELCTHCSGELKNKPMVGLQIIRGAKKAGHLNVWDSGFILDPEKGSSYGLELTPANEGQQLMVRGSYGPFSRTQTWVRVK